MIAGNQWSAGAWRKTKAVSLLHWISMKLFTKEKQDRMKMDQAPINTDFVKTCI